MSPVIPVIPVIRSVLVLAALFFGLLLLANPAPAMQPMSEAEMDQVTGQYGFSEFKIIDDTNAQMKLNIQGEIYADIDRFGANYDDNGVIGNPADQEWLGVRLGRLEEVDNDDDIQHNLVFKEFFLEAQFQEEIGGPEPNKLQYLRMGFNDVSGEISADATRYDPELDGGFNSFSGYYGGPPTRAQHYRANLGDGYFTFTNDRAHMILDARGMDAAGTSDPNFPPGIYMDFGNADFTDYPNP